MKSHSQLRSVALCLGMLALASASSAHHSAAAFNWGTESTLSGTVERYEWTQPHTFLWMQVKDKQGRSQEWGLEGMTPSALGRAGWKRTSRRPGDKVEVVYYALRDHRPGGYYVRVTLADGQVLKAFAQPGQ